MVKYQFNWFANRILYLDVFLEECVLTFNLSYDIDSDLLTAWCEND